MPGDSQAPGFRDTIFAAIRLDESTARRAGEITRRAYEEHGLDGKPRPLGNLHITVVYFGLYLSLGEDGIERARRACALAAARLEPFEAQLDQLKTFQGRPWRPAPLVLVNAGKHAPFQDCYRALFEEAKELGLVQGNPPRFTPHVTTAYSSKQLAPQFIEPITWEVTELVLIHSFVGRTKYEELGRWGLGA